MRLTPARRALYNSGHIKEMQVNINGISMEMMKNLDLLKNEIIIKTENGKGEAAK